MIRRPPRSTLFPYTTLFRSRPALQGVSLELRAGESVALVGETGAGKSTIVKLLARFYDPTEGRILVDRKSTRLNSSHANISYAVFCLKKKNHTSLKYIKLHQ